MACINQRGGRLSKDEVRVVGGALLQPARRVGGVVLRLIVIETNVNLVPAALLGVDLHLLLRLVLLSHKHSTPSTSRARSAHPNSMSKRSRSQSRERMATVFGASGSTCVCSFLPFHISILLITAGVAAGASAMAAAADTSRPPADARGRSCARLLLLPDRRAAGRLTCGSQQLVKPLGRLLPAWRKQWACLGRRWPSHPSHTPTPGETGGDRRPLTAPGLQHRQNAHLRGQRGRWAALHRLA